jgi:hypothetical protein
MYKETMGGVKPAGEITADVVVGLQYGDEAKGKCAHDLCKSGQYARAANTLTS